MFLRRHFCRWKTIAQPLTHYYSGWAGTRLRGEGRFSVGSISCTEEGEGLLFFGICVLMALALYLLLLGASRGKDWEREDREQLEYLRQYQAKREEKRKRK